MSLLDSTARITSRSLAPLKATPCKRLSEEAKRQRSRDARRRVRARGRTEIMLAFQTAYGSRDAQKSRQAPRNGGQVVEQLLSKETLAGQQTA